MLVLLMADARRHLRADDASWSTAAKTSTFNLSLWSAYNVMLMHTAIAPVRTSLLLRPRDSESAFL